MGLAPRQPPADEPLDRRLLGEGGVGAQHGTQRRIAAVALEQALHRLPARVLDDG